MTCRMEVQLVGPNRPRASVCVTILGMLLLGALSGCATPPPQQVVQQAMEAARDGDREAFRACFTPRSQPVLDTWWDTVDVQNPTLGALDAKAGRVMVERLIPSRDLEPERALLEIREGDESIRVVVHRLGGMWRIDLFDTERVSAISSGP